MKQLPLTKQLFVACIVVLFLAACSKEEQATPVAEEQAAVTAETVATDNETVAADAAAEDVLEVVEESAAEPETGEQAILLAQADTKPEQHDWQFTEGKNYHRLVPTQPTVGGADKIEVAEFFWYGCPHCYDNDSIFNAWAKTKPANVRFVHVPAMWNGLLKLHAQLYYTEEVMERNGVIKEPAVFRSAIFSEYHQRGNRMASKGAIQKVFARLGVSADDFESTWDSFEVSQKLRVAQDLARRYSITGVPTVVVNGKYRAGAADAGSYPKLIELIDELVARESIR